MRKYILNSKLKEFNWELMRAQNAKLNQSRVKKIFQWGIQNYQRFEAATKISQTLQWVLNCKTRIWQLKITLNTAQSKCLSVLTFAFERTSSRSTQSLGICPFYANHPNIERLNKPWHARSLINRGELVRDAIILHLYKPNKSQKVKRTMQAMYLYCLTVNHALCLSKETFNTRAHG